MSSDVADDLGTCAFYPLFLYYKEITSLLNKARAKVVAM